MDKKQLIMAKKSEAAHRRCIIFQFLKAPAPGWSSLLLINEALWSGAHGSSDGCLLLAVPERSRPQQPASALREEQKGLLGAARSWILLLSLLPVLTWWHQHGQRIRAGLVQYWQNFNSAEERCAFWMALLTAACVMLDVKNLHRRNLSDGTFVAFITAHYLGSLNQKQRKKAKPLFFYCSKAN